MAAAGDGRLVLAVILAGLAGDMTKMMVGANLNIASLGEVTKQSSAATRGGVVSDRNLWLSRYGVPRVMYKFGDPTVSEPAIMAGIATYEADTCIRFEKAGPVHLAPHLMFRSSSTSCSTVVGRQWLGWVWFGQDVLLTQNCIDDPSTVLRMLGHSLGVYLQHGRSDRNSFVRVVPQNILPAMVNNYLIRNTRNMAVPYDYTSIFHFGPLTGSSTGQSVMYTLNPALQGLMFVPRPTLTFMDKLLINRLYQCTDYWLGLCNRPFDPCQNLGYMGAGCTCVCPAGTTGMYCNIMADSYTDALVNAAMPLNEALAVVGTIKSKGYPTPYDPASIFSKVVTAPACHTLEVIGFEMAPRCSDGLCCLEGVEIRLGGAASNGIWYCGTDLAVGDIFKTMSSMLIVLYVKQEVTGNLYPGFSFDIQFVSC